MYGINPSDTAAFGSPAMNRTIFKLYCSVFCLGAAGDPDRPSTSLNRFFSDPDKKLRGNIRPGN